MINNFHQIYIENIFKLVRSIVLKSEFTAQRINDALYIKRKDHLYDKDDRRTWKYYKNVSGEYFECDTPMYVLSMDTRERILFSKENLKNHAETRIRYSPGNKEYNQLVSTYPDQEDLIIGIVNPVDIEEAIESKEFTILNYNKSLVEDNEYTLMLYLQEYIYAHSGRYMFPMYNRTDDLYYAVYMSNLVASLLPAIYNYRLSKAKNHEAHSYHVNNHVLSHLGLHEHIENLSPEQKMFFLRNSGYIERHIGNQDTFNWLKEKIVDEANINLFRYEMVHDTAGMPDNDSPNSLFKQISLTGNATNTKLGVSEFLDKFDNLAQDNFIDRIRSEPIVKTRAKHSLSNKQSTKLLETTSSIIKRSDYYNREDILFNHWIYLATNNKYNRKINILIPSSNIDINLNMREAFILYLYSYSRYIELTDVNYPNYIAQRVYHLPERTIDELKEVVSDVYISDEDIEILTKDKPEPFTEIVSVNKFMEYCEHLHTYANYQINKVRELNELVRRGYAHGLISKQWSNVTIDLSINTETGNREPRDYKTWLRLKGIDIEQIQPSETRFLWKSILYKCTGINLDADNDVITKQKSAIELMNLMSSYSIKFINSNESTNVMEASVFPLRYEVRKVNINSAPNDDNNGITHTGGSFNNAGMPNWFNHFLFSTDKIGVTRFDTDTNYYIFDNLSHNGVYEDINIIIETEPIRLDLVTGIKDASVSPIRHYQFSVVVGPYSIIGSKQHSVRLLSKSTIGAYKHRLVSLGHSAKLNSKSTIGLNKVNIRMLGNLPTIPESGISP